MKFIVKPSSLSGAIHIPGSKSHTIRALVFGLLAEGTSEISAPLESSDTASCIETIRHFGAGFKQEGELWKVEGTGGHPCVPENIIDVGNSGTTLYIAMGIASLVQGTTVLTGDGQIRNRPAEGLLGPINALGGTAFSTRKNGRPPLVITGTMKGGSASIEAVTSQYLTSLLIAAPLAPGDTTLMVPLLHEVPYVTMTLRWLDMLGITYRNTDYREFFIPGNQKYRSFRYAIPADFSSATFFLVAAAISGTTLTLQGLDMEDPQGDKEVLHILREMGADITIQDRNITIQGGTLRGGTFDLNAIPDALPALSVAGCFAEGETRLINVPQARLKETDRISVMYTELTKMGAVIEELPDGLILHHSRLKGTAVEGHGDHRVVMALAVAGTASEGDTIISTAEAVSVTFPSFLNLLQSLGGNISTSED